MVCRAKKRGILAIMLSNCFFTLKKNAFASFCWETCLFVKLCDKLDFKRKLRALQEIIFFFLVLATLLWNTLYIIKNKKLIEQIKTYVTTSKWKKKPHRKIEKGWLSKILNIRYSKTNTKIKEYTHKAWSVKTCFWLQNPIHSWIFIVTHKDLQCTCSNM